MNIVTLDEIKLQLDIPTSNTDYDEMLTNIADSVEAYVESYTGCFFYTRDIKGVAYKPDKREYSLDWTRNLYVPYNNINSDSVLGGDVNIQAGTYGLTYGINTEVLWKTGGSFYFTNDADGGDLYIEFNSGYDKPADIVQTIIDSVRIQFRHITDNADMIASKTVGGESTTYNLFGFSDIGKKILKKYKDNSRIFTMLPNEFLETTLVPA